MEAIKIEVAGNIARVIEKPLRITSGTVGLPVEFTFDSQWEGLSKIAVFQAGYVRKDMEVVDDATVVPMEITVKPNVRLNIGVYGVNEDSSVAIPTIWANAGQIRDGAVPGGSTGSDIGIAKKYYDEAMQAAKNADASAKKAESEAGVAETNADRAEASAKEADVARSNAQVFANDAGEANRQAEEAADRAEEAAKRAEAGSGASIIVAVDEGNVATHNAAEIYDAIENKQTVVYRHDDRLGSEFISLKTATPDVAVFSKTGYPTEFDIFNIEIDSNGTVNYQTSSGSTLVQQAVEKVETDTAPVSYLPQDPTHEQQAQARENIGVNPYYCTTREALGIAYEDVNADYIFGLYDALMAEYPDRVQKNEVHNDDGTFTNYEYVISTGEYSTDGAYVKIYGKDPYAKKPKFLVLSGIHGNERNTVYSTYRFIRDVLNGHNVPDAFREGAIISVMPIGTPSAFNAFLRQNDNAVDINRNFDSEWASGTSVDDKGNRLTHGSAAASEKETQAIAKWLNANSDAKLYIDFHNSGALNEKVLVFGLPDDSVAGTARKIALRGVDHIIPYWRDVIGYPDKVEANGVTDDGTGREVKERDTIYSYSATAALGGASFAYAQNVVGIPSFTLETAVYYGNHTDWIANITADSPEAVAMGAEALGNILIEFYNNEVTNMATVDSKLDNILDRVNSGFHTESGVLVIDEDINGGTSIISTKIPCTSGAKMLTLQADDDTYAKIVASPGAYWTIGCFGNCVTKVGGYDNRGYLARMIPYPNDSTKWYAADAGTTFDNTDGFSFNHVAMKAGRYNWTAYYWNE